MKGKLAVISFILVLILLLAGCATTSRTEGEETDGLEYAASGEGKLSASSGKKQNVSGKGQKTASPEITAGPEDVIPVVLAEELGLDALFDEADGWPENFRNPPVAMAPAEDESLWVTFINMAESNASADELESYLLDWYADYGWTPEFYAASANYFFIKTSEVLDAAVTDEDIQTVYDYFDRCFAATFHGGMQYPDRLDLWCGYVHTAILLGYPSSASDCCTLIFDRLERNGGNWYWTCNEPFYGSVDESVREAEFVDIIHDYIAEWLNSSETLPYALSAAKRLAENFPGNAVALNDLALSLNYSGNLEDSLFFLEKAHEADPEDLLVIENLIYTETDLGDVTAAKYYANILIQSGDEVYVDMGIRLLADLNGKAE